MPRENSFSDSDGRSLTPDLEDEVNPYPPASPNYPSSIPYNNSTELRPTNTRDSTRSRAAGIRSAASSSLHPKDRFRHAVRKVMALHRGANIIMSRRGAGAEPGVDPRRPAADAEYGGIKQDCVIELADYSAVRSSVGRMKNREFVDFMNDAGASAREPWVKVRWINIGGMSWDVVKAVSIKYGLHPLALEDIFHTHPRARSKADYYAQHLFLRVLCHELGSDLSQPSIIPISTHTNLPPSYPPGAKTTSGLTVHSSSSRRPLLRKRSSDLGVPGLSSDITQVGAAAAGTADENRRIQDAAVAALKRGERVDVNVVPIFIFLFRDGTVITIHSTPTLDLTEPITSRVRQFDSVLRTSADASLLVQSLLALIVDNALEVVNAYQDKIKKFERKIMAKPTIGTVRNLHILSADLILHRRTLAPIKTVVYGLRRYDIDRAAALVDVSVSVKDHSHKVEGFMSHKSLIYLADVHDHMEYVLSQLDVIAGIGQNLVDYTFNMTSYEMNEVMRRLMLVTVIFLPLTLLAGYFGMNFEGMNIVKGPEHGDWIYWAIALPIMVVIVPLFVAPDIKRLVRHVQKRLLTRNVVKSFNA
ncbi:Magnesium-like protein [Mycena venus]|uniref:Magnesium-like protein n=1 Tax=Mycena venus TaxID=2733690 RepID=A0A8H6YGH2_9AGAR|nr:Magnesium-like protein [Mycena venus]